MHDLGVYILSPRNPLIIESGFSQPRKTPSPGSAGKPNPIENALEKHEDHV